MEPSLDAKIDRTLSGFLDQLFQQRRRSALPGPRGGAIFSDPVTVDVVLRAPDQFPKIFLLLQSLGRSRFGTNGTEWEHRRNLTQRQYVQAGKGQNREDIAEVYHRRLADCDGGDRDLMASALFAASTEVFYDAFDVAAPVDSMVRFFERARNVVKRLQYYSLIQPNAELRSALEEEGRSLAREYRQEAEASAQLRALMEEFRTQAAGEIEDFVPSDEFMMNFFAAVEGTTGTLMSAIDRLGAYPEVQQELAAEVAADRTFPMLEGFINEVLRCYPAVPFLVRQVLSETEIQGLRLKTGSVIILSIVGVNRHPEYWSNPDAFDSRRAEFVENNFDRRAFIPFSVSSRGCAGAQLARMELSEGLKAFIRRFRVERQGIDISFEYTIAMRPRSWNRLEINRR